MIRTICLNILVFSDDGNNKHGVFVNFSLCGCCQQTVMLVCEFDVMEFNVSSGLCGERIVGLKAFNKKDVWLKA